MSLLVLLALLLPLLALALLVLFWRWGPTRLLAPALLGCGLGGALLAALFTFTRTTVPIAPYETGPGAWTQVILAVALGAWLGFGLGILLASPVALVVGLIRSGRKTPPPAD